VHERDPTPAGAPSPRDPRRVLIQAARRFYRRGWMMGTAGNLSLRLADGSFWITASGKAKGALGVRDFVRVGPRGELLERGSDLDRPSAETTLHEVVYRLFPRAAACYHVHTVAANVVSHLAGASPWIPLPPIEMIKGLGVWDERPEVAIAHFANHAHVPSIAAEVERDFGAEPPRLPGFLIRDHGLTVWGDDPQAAQNHLELIEFIFQAMAQTMAAQRAAPPSA
jgi:methylthioribulose-1-phosphate dehydratase